MNCINTICLYLKKYLTDEQFENIFYDYIEDFQNSLEEDMYLNVLSTNFATVYKGNIIKNLIMDCQSYTKYRPNETTGGIFVSWRRKEELPTGA